MLKIINYSIILLFFVTIENFSAQTLKDTTESKASPKAVEITNYKLTLNPFLNTQKIFLGQKDFEIRSWDLLQQQINSEENSPQSIEEQKIQLNDYISQRRNLLPNYDLGDFGKYLGYANAFAAVLLAIAHISKYGFK